MAKGFSFEEALQPATKGFSFEEALQPKPEPVLSPEEQVTSQVGQTTGTTAADLAKLTAAGAVKGTLGAPEAIESGLAATAKGSMFGPTEALNLIADPRALTNKLAGAIGISPIFEEKKLVPEETTAKQRAAVDEIFTKGKVPQLRTLTEFGNKLSEDIESSISPEMKLALAESQPTGNILKALETGDFSEVSLGKNPTFLGLSGQAAKVFGSAAPAFLTAGLTKSVGPAAAVGFGQAGAEGVDEARNYIDKMTDEELTKKSEYFRNLVALGYTPRDAREMTIVKAGDTAALYQGTVGALGGAFTNKLLQGAFDKTLLSSAKSRLGKIVQGTALGAGEGGLSEMAEGVATDLGIDKSVVREIGVDSFANLVLGALGEGAPGTVRGAIARTEAETPAEVKAEVTPQPVEVTPAITPEPVQVAPQEPVAAAPVEVPLRAAPGAIQEEQVEPVTPEAAPQTPTVTAVTPTAPAETPIAEPAVEAPKVTQEAKAVEKALQGVRADEVPLHEFNLGILDAMNKSQPNPELVSEEAIKLLVANELVKRNANNKLELLPKGNQMLTALRDVSGFGKPQLDADEQKALFARFIPQIATGEVVAQPESVAPQATEVVEEPLKGLNEAEKKSSDVFKKILADNPDLEARYKESHEEDMLDPSSNHRVEEHPNSKNLNIGDTVYEKGDPVPKYVLNIGENDSVKLIDSDGKSFAGWKQIDEIAKNPIDYDHKFDFGFGPVNVNISKWLRNDDEWQFDMYGPGASETGYRSVLGIKFDGKPGTKKFNEFVERVAKANALTKPLKAKKPTKEEKVAANKARQEEKKAKKEKPAKAEVKVEKPKEEPAKKETKAEVKKPSKELKIPKVDESWAEFKQELKAKPSTMDQDVWDKYLDFQKGNFAFTKTSFTGANALARENAANALAQQIYDKAAREFLNHAISAKAPAKAQAKLTPRDGMLAVPPPIAKNIKSDVSTLDKQKKAIMAIAAPKTELRKMLQGVLVEPNQLVVTDGHRLAVYKTDTGVEERQILDKDGKVMDTTYPRYEMIMDKAKGAIPLGPVNATALGNYARGARNAWKYISADKNSPFSIQVGNNMVGFNSKYIEEMANMFRQFGYEGFDASFDDRGGGGGMLIAVSPDGKLAQYVMSMKNEERYFMPFNIEEGQPGFIKSEEEVKPEYTKEEREDAEHHARDLGGEVAYQKGDLALIRGYSVLSGAPTYAVAKGKQRSKVEVGSYTGNLISSSEKADLLKVVENLEKEAQQQHKESPYIKFKDGIALSEDIPADLGGVIKEWKNLLGLKANIYVSTTENAKENKSKFTGPHRVIGSGTLSTTEAGSMRRMPDDSYYVLFETKTSKTRMLETIAHELGHVHEREVYSGASPETKKAIKAEFEKWVLSQKGKSAEQLINSLRAKSSAKTTSVPAGTKAEDLSPYWTSFGEWYADQVSRWATTTETPLTIVEKFFKRLGNQMRRFYNNLTNKGYLPNETFKQYLDSLVDSKDPVADTGEEADFAPEAMAKKIIPRADKVDELLEKYERSDTPLHPSGEVKDAILGSYQKSKKIATKMAENPLMTGVNMVGKVDRAVTYALNKNVWFGKGLDQADFARYNGQLRDSNGLAVASVAVTNAIHAGHVGTQVMIQGGLEFNYDPETGKGTQMFQAVKKKFSMANVVRLKHDLEEKIGAQRASNMINAYFEAKRSRSIVEEFLNREKQYLDAVESGEPEEEAAKNLKNIEVAMQKVNMDDEQIDDFIALEKDYPELRKMMDNWTEVNHNMLDMMAFSGVISKKRATQLKAIKDYVPWYRIMDDQSDIHQAVGVRGLTNVGQEKKFKAGEVNRDIDDIVDNMIHNVMMMTRNSMKNYAANRVAMEYATRKENGKIQLYPSEGSDANGVRTNIIINGRRAIVNIPDPLVAEAVLGMENIEIPMIEILAFFAQGLRRGITTFPVFQVSQLFMDAPTAAWVSGVKNPFALMGSTFGGFVRALLPGDPIVAMLKSYGIGGYQSSARTPEKELKLEIGLLDKSVWSKAMKTLDHIGDASDYAQRRAIYKRVLKETGDEMQALIQANNVIDFLKRGSGKGAQFVTRTVSFMNAYAQSIDVLAQALAGGGLKGKSRKAAQAQMIKTGMLLAGTTILYCMAAGADDEYDKLDDQTKIRNIIIPGTKIRLPMHTSASFFFKAIPELIYNKVMKDGTKNQMDNTRLRKALGEAAIDSLLGPNMIPTGIKPIAEIALNHNFFTGGTLTPRGMEKLEAFRQYTSSTSELGKVMSALTRGALNPIEMDHLMRGLFGTAGSAVMYGSNLFSGDRVAPQAKDNPLYGSFILADVPRGREDLFYDLKERSDKKYETFVNLMKNQRGKEGQEYRAENKGLIAAHGFVTAADADLKRINAEIRRISDLPEVKMSSAEKRAKITQFQNEKNNILEQTIKFRLRAGL